MQIKDLFDALATLTLPSSIRHLHIGLSQASAEISTAESQEKLFLLKEHLFHNYSVLRRIQIDLSGHYISWTHLDE